MSGAQLAKFLPKEYFTPIVLVALVVVGLYTWRRPQLGMVSERKHEGGAHYGRTALIGLATDIIGRHAIPARNVVGHSDIAPTRKQDPGALFPWRDLAEVHGIGLWPCGEPTALPPEHVLQAGLAHAGYDIADPTAALTAFQRHFRPWKVDGHLDPETAGRLRPLLRVLR